MKSQVIYPDKGDCKNIHHLITASGLVAGYVGAAALTYSWTDLVPTLEHDQEISWTRQMTTGVMVATHVAFVIGETFLGSFLTTRSSRRIDPILTVFLIMCFVMSLMSVIHTRLPIAACLTIAATCNGACYVLFSHATMNALPPKYFDATLMALGLAVEIGSVAAAWIIGYTLDYYSWRVALAMVIIFSAVCGLYYVYATKLRLRGQWKHAQAKGDIAHGKSKADHSQHSHSRMLSDLGNVLIEMLKDQEAIHVIVQLSAANFADIYSLHLPALTSDFLGASAADAAVTSGWYCSGAVLGLLVATSGAVYFSKEQLRQMQMTIVAAGCLCLMAVGSGMLSMLMVKCATVIIGAGIAIPMYSPYSQLSEGGRDAEHVSLKIAVGGGIGTAVGVLGILATGYVRSSMDTHSCWLFCTVIPSVALSLCSWSIFSQYCELHRKKERGIGATELCSIANGEIRDGPRTTIDHAEEEDPIRRCME